MGLNTVAQAATSFLLACFLSLSLSLSFSVNSLTPAFGGHLANKLPAPKPWSGLCSGEGTIVSLSSFAFWPIHFPSLHELLL